MAPDSKLKVMVSSSVYGAESLLDQIYGILEQYGYDVWMSHKGTVPTDPRKTAFENCLDAVEQCDIFLGIITGNYGSGQVAGQPSITHQEIRRAVARDKLRWYLVHHNVTIIRQVLKQFRFDSEGNPLPLVLKRTPVLSDIRVLEMYEEALQLDRPYEARSANWVQPFFNDEDVLLFLHTQFADVGRIRSMLSL